MSELVIELFQAFDRVLIELFKFFIYLFGLFLGVGHVLLNGLQAISQCPDNRRHIG